MDYTGHFSPTLVGHVDPNNTNNNNNPSNAPILGTSPPPGFSLSNSIGGPVFNLPPGASSFSNGSSGRPSRGSSFGSFDSSSPMDNINMSTTTATTIGGPTAVPYAPSLYPSTGIGGINGIGGISGVGGGGCVVGGGTNVQQQQSQQQIISQQQQIQLEIKMQQQQIQNLQATLRTQMAQMQWQNPAQGNPNQMMQMQQQMMGGSMYGLQQQKQQPQQPQNGGIQPSSLSTSSQPQQLQYHSQQQVQPQQQQQQPQQHQTHHQQQHHQQRQRQPPPLLRSQPQSSTRSNSSTNNTLSSSSANTSSTLISSNGRLPVAPTSKPKSGGWASIVASNRPALPPPTKTVHRGKTQSLQKKTTAQSVQKTTNRTAGNKTNNGGNNTSQQRRRSGSGSSGNKNEANHKNNKQQNKEQFLINIDTLKNGVEQRTTLMIRNIPNKYTRTMLVDELNEDNFKCYDFLYLPIDFRNKCNLGYAFINMINPQNVIDLYNNFRGKSWQRSRSEKKADVKWGRLQSKNALIEHFRASSFLKRIPPDSRPISFWTDGPNKGLVEFYIGDE